MGATFEQVADSSSVNGSQQHDDAEEEEDSARGEPSEDTEPILHATVPALEPANDNEAAATVVPPPANDNTAEDLPATGTE